MPIPLYTQKTSKEAERISKIFKEKHDFREMNGASAGLDTGQTSQV
jgi:hypothetical protein